MRMDQRYEANAILENILADGDTFDASRASRLIEMIPFTKGGNFVIGGFYEGEGTTSAHAAGVGSVSVGDDVKKSFSVGETVHRVGGYKLKHRRGKLYIALMWEGTHEDGGARRARLTYDPVTKVPSELRLLGPDRVIALGPIAIQFNTGAYHPWKKPKFDNES